MTRLLTAPPLLTPAFAAPALADTDHRSVPRPLDSGFLHMPTPIGRLELQSIDGAVSAVQVEQSGRLPCDGSDEQPTGVLLDAAEQLEEYFQGTRKEFDLPLVATGTPFQHGVWTALGETPFGSAVGYGALAAAAGAPRGGRAAGQAVRANTLAILIPCHRALGSGGRVTGYSGGDGLSTKCWLLDHEGIPYRR